MTTDLVKKVFVYPSEWFEPTSPQLTGMGNEIPIMRKKGMKKIGRLLFHALFLEELGIASNNEQQL